LEQSEAAAATAVQNLLDLEHDALLRGDGELYFSFYHNTPAWFSAQLQPQNLQAARAGYRVTRAEPHDDFIWANLAWTTSQQAKSQRPTETTYQRIAFFQWQNGRLLHASTAPDYWGSWISYEEPWGALIFTERDELWAGEVADFVAEVVAEICEQDCVNGRLPITLHLANDYSDTAVPSQLRIPSPRLIALDEGGQPADLFWQSLRQRLETHLAPITIRFALPEPDLPGVYLIDFQQAAAEFMALHPDITVELVTLEGETAVTGQLMTQFDGFAFSPTADIIASGHVYDLTSLAATDPTFDQIDFYPAIWQGTQWRRRMWFMPLAAQMNLIFYSQDAYAQADLPEPSLRWTWDEMAAHLDALDAAQVYGPFREYLFYDVGPDILFAYAYNWNNPCGDTSPADCRQPIPVENIAAALEWYQQMVAQPQRMPDVASFSEEDRAYSRYRLWAAVWVDELVFYEHRLDVLSQLGVVPFPGSDRFDGVTPLWVDGVFISRYSPHPRAVWEWLKFLSYQPPAPRYRLIPARPSIARQTAYWTTLPRPLSEAMRAAFPFTRPVSIDDQSYFSLEQLTAVTSGHLTPSEAARRPQPITWFTRP
jgi:ABC-type glycerol-3-phosphate transport system substrate-binding protein